MPTSIVVPPALKAAVQAKAAAEGRTLTDVTLDAYRRYVGERTVYDAMLPTGSAAWQIANAPTGSAHGAPDLRTVDDVAPRRESEEG